MTPTSNTPTSTPRVTLHVIGRFARLAQVYYHITHPHAPRHRILRTPIEGLLQAIRHQGHCHAGRITFLHYLYICASLFHQSFIKRHSKQHPNQPAHPSTTPRTIHMVYFIS